MFPPITETGFWEICVLQEKIETAPAVRSHNVWLSHTWRKADEKEKALFEGFVFATERLSVYGAFFSVP